MSPPAWRPRATRNCSAVPSTTCSPTSAPTLPPTRSRRSAPPVMATGSPIEVSDNGPGVPADRLPSIFDRFYRATPARARCPGSGLGLAIVAAVAATHHGTATAELNDPHGLRVTLALPASSSAGQCPCQVPAPWLTAQTVRHELRQSDRHDRGGGDRRADHLPGDRAR